ncbi:hypothetical protein [Burkholderia gladioli]|uniref:hypothetical protein n=1 Tax=Burkholderia gladioli TaxID=28095 RepID=UPI00163E6283|nr:hypothetical protein [Burkholderia gladioli]
MRKPYLMTHDCPHCGEKDEPDAWMGARMSSSEWGHDFCCCSDACGRAFAEKHRELEKTRKGRRQLAKLWQELESQADHRLCGEPYYGYEAEQTLKWRGAR